RTSHSSGPSHTTVRPSTWAVVFGSTGKPGGAGPRTDTCASTTGSLSSAVTATSLRVVQARGRDLGRDRRRVERCMDDLAQPLPAPPDERERKGPPERGAPVAGGDVPDHRPRARSVHELSTLRQQRVRVERQQADQ